jgi:hypothetical protein
MLEDLFTLPAAAQRARSCALGAHLDEFCTHLKVPRRIELPRG